MFLHSKGHKSELISLQSPTKSRNFHCHWPALGSTTYCAVDVVSGPQARDFDAWVLCKDRWQASKACEARWPSSGGMWSSCVSTPHVRAWYSFENAKSLNCSFTCQSCTWAMRCGIVEGYGTNVDYLGTNLATGEFFCFCLHETISCCGRGWNLRPCALS